MAMTAAVKDEVSRLPVTRTCCRKAEVSAILRFAGGLHLVRCGDDDWGRTWSQVIQHRFVSQGDLHGHAVGNLLIVALWEHLGARVAAPEGPRHDPELLAAAFDRIFRMHGRIGPWR